MKGWLRLAHRMKGVIMNTLNKNVYQDRKDKQEDAYSQAIFTYAEAWGDLMEARINNGEAIEDIAKETSHEADTDGITGFMYGAAVSILSQCWVHGEQLRKWHNLDTQIGDEGEKANEEGGVLNPALLNVA